MQGEGQPEAYIAGAAGGTEESGRLETSVKPAPLKDAKFGATRRSIAGTAKWTEDAGRLVDSSPARLKEREEGATWKRVAGPVGRCRSRGNSEPHREAERDDA
jgi:hypothetical protein